MTTDRGNERPDDLVQFEKAFWAIATGADDLARRTNRYHILMGAKGPVAERRHFARWADVVAALEALDPAALPLEPRDKRYVADILRAFQTFARVRAGAEISYSDQVEAFLDLREIWIPEAELASLQQRILAMLVDRRFPDDLARGLKAWERGRAIDSSRIANHCRPLIAASLRASCDRGIPIPAAVEVDVSVRSTPYYAYAHYHGAFRGTVELTSDLPWTIEGLKHSICHEAFPGHQASASAREWAIHAGTWAAIQLPGLANTPVSPIAEGLAENGARILGWIETEDDLLFSLQNRLQFGVRTNAAIMRHEHGASKERVIAYMMQEAGVPSDWAHYHEAFIADPLWHTSFPHYWHGANVIQNALSQFQGREPALFAELYGHPHTTGTLRDWLAADAQRTRSDMVRQPTPAGGRRA
ncbi:MAG: hypothetical protein K0S78_2223 [Thermomicrobiales bacterium]|nr:hypothetical protein [Thermomicrobiales bacterium]